MAKINCRKCKHYNEGRVGNNERAKACTRFGWALIKGIKIEQCTAYTPQSAPTQKGR